MPFRGISWLVFLEPLPTSSQRWEFIKEKKEYLKTCFFSWSRSCFLTFFLVVFLYIFFIYIFFYKFPPQRIAVPPPPLGSNLILIWGRSEEKAGLKRPGMGVNGRGGELGSKGRGYRRNCPLQQLYKYISNLIIEYFVCEWINSLQSLNPIF